MRAGMMILVALACLLSGAQALSLADSPNELPLTKVIRLLKDMQKDVEAEAKRDEETYSKLKCWCETNEKEKTQAVDDARQKIDQLEATIQGAAGKTSSAEVRIEQLKKDIEEAKAALAEATEIRKKEAAEFHDAEKELIQSVTLLRGAIEALSKHHPAMLQADASLATMKPSLRHLLHKHLAILGFLKASPDRDAFLNFLDAESDILEPDTSPAFLQEKTVRSSLPYVSYAPQSGMVMGVLKQLKETFEGNLPEIQQQEMQKIQQFAALKGAKESEIAGNEEMLKTTTEELANAKEELATAKNELEDTKESLSADQKFLLQLTSTCTEGDYEYDRRRQMRADELKAVTEAIAVLSGDELRDAQQTTFGFLQMFSRRVRMHGNPQALARNRAAKRLQSMQGTSLHQEELALLATSVVNEPFAKVIAAVDELVAKLKLEQADEVKHHDYCIDSLHENQVETERKNAEKTTLEAVIEDLKTQAEVLTKDIAQLKTDINDLQVQLQAASENRKLENQEFQRVAGDQKRTQMALKAAGDKLAAFYAKKQSLMQRSKQPVSNTKPSAKAFMFLQATKSGDEPESIDARPASETYFEGEAPKFAPYEKHTNANPVMNLIEKLIGDAQVLIDESYHNEQNAQAAYEKMIAETNDSVKAKSRLVVDKTEELASVDEEKANKSVERDQVIETLSGLAETKGALLTECTFLLDNFDARQAARAAEIESLGQVKAILSGMQ